MLTWAREQEMKNASASKLDLTDYLIKPVQRICKYPLLFRVRLITPIPFSCRIDGDTDDWAGCEHALLGTRRS
jgi:hypothetical protein